MYVRQHADMPICLEFNNLRCASIFSQKHSSTKIIYKEIRRLCADFCIAKRQYTYVETNGRRIICIVEYLLRIMRLMASMTMQKSKSLHSYLKRRTVGRIGGADANVRSSVQLARRINFYAILITICCYYCYGFKSIDRV